MIGLRLDDVSFLYDLTMFWWLLWVTFVSLFLSPSVSFVFFLCLHLLRIKYIIYVRPRLEYCSVAWNPSLKKDIESLTKVHSDGSQSAFHAYSIYLAYVLLLCLVNKAEYI